MAGVLAVARAISARRPCEVCGRLLRADSKYGICETRPECRRVKAERIRRGKGILADPRRRPVVAGEAFGLWTVTENYAGGGRVACRCACGIERRVSLNALKMGKSGSCGCARRKPWKTLANPYMPAGAVFGRLTALEAARVSHDRIRFRCGCGTEITADSSAVRRGHTVSCGCKRRQAWLKHGLSQHPLYQTWSEIQRRTTKATHPSYADYGGRGICLHPDWLGMPDGFRRFAEWIEANLGPRPDGNSLDRIDNDGGYEPGNLRWATWTQQGRNRRTVGALTAQRDALLELLLANQELAERARAIVA